MIMVKKLDQIRKMAGKVYVRWSESIAKDNKRGYSLRYGTQAEAGLSACEIDKDWEDWRILRQLQEYQFCGGDCWIVTGDEVGTGADNEPLLRNVKALGKVGYNLTKANYRKMELEADIAADEERLTRITDKIGRKIVEKSLAKNKAELKRMSK